MVPLHVDLAPSVVCAARVPPLPKAPLIERFVLENPWPGVVLLLLAALAGFAALNARARLRDAMLVSTALLLAAVGLLIISARVQTPREQIFAETGALVAAVAKVNLPQLDRMLSDDLSVRVTRVPRSADKHAVMDLVESILGRQYQVRDCFILEMQATIDGPRLGRSQVRVRADSAYGSIPSWWRVDWELAADGRWRVRRIEALWIPGVVNPAGTD